MITVLADQHLFKIKEIIPDEINLQLYDPENGLPGNIDQADALLIRTVTKINKHTLHPIPKKLKFLATGSAGTDHVDIDFLKEHGVGFAYSPGCNARSVAEYVVTALLIWAEKKQVDLDAESIGIIGAGHVGSALLNVLDRMKWKYVCYDPPRAARDSSFHSAELSDVLNCSILSFHTSLTCKGSYPTYHWLDKEKLSGNKFKLILNTARGGVVDEQALLQSLQTGRVEDMIMDVWENEPLFNDTVAQKAFIATPHIAGYSVQSKFRASKMIVEALARYFSLNLPIHPLPEKVHNPISGNQKARDFSLLDIFDRIHPIKNYHNALKKLAGMERTQKTRKFNRLRTSIPYRNEYDKLIIPKAILGEFPVLNGLIIKDKNP